MQLPSGLFQKGESVQFYHGMFWIDRFYMYWLFAPHPSSHEAIVVWKADEFEGRFLDEIRVQDPYVFWFSGNATCHRLPESLHTPLKDIKSGAQN